MAPVFEDPPAETNLPGNQISSSSLAYVIVMGTLVGMALVVVFLKLITLGKIVGIRNYISPELSML